MSRLIGADELMRAMYHRAFETDGDTMWQSGCWVRYRAIEQVVKEQPTIEERKKGKWIQREKCYPDIEKQMDYRYECSECGFSDIHNATLEVPFCWHCGADMRGDDHADD